MRRRRILVGALVLVVVLLFAWHLWARPRLVQWSFVQISTNGTDFYSPAPSNDFRYLPERNAVEYLGADDARHSVCRVDAEETEARVKIAVYECRYGPSDLLKSFISQPRKRTHLEQPIGVREVIEAKTGRVAKRGKSPILECGARPVATDLCSPDEGSYYSATYYVP